MRQVVSLVKDGRVSFALVDDESGDMVMFAEVVLPNPDHFGLAEAAALGSNLIAAVGLNGHKRAGRPKALPPAQPTLEEASVIPPESPPSPPRQERRGVPTPAERPYISLEMVIDIVNRHPDGITPARIADVALGRLGWSGPKPKWARVAVTNRLLAEEARLKAGAIEHLPYESVLEPFVKADGSLSAGQNSRVLYPRGGVT